MHLLNNIIHYIFIPVFFVFFILSLLKSVHTLLILSVFFSACLSGTKSLCCIVWRGIWINAKITRGYRQPTKITFQRIIVMIVRFDKYEAPSNNIIHLFQWLMIIWNHLIICCFVALLKSMGRFSLFYLERFRAFTIDRFWTIVHMGTCECFRHFCFFFHYSLSLLFLWEHGIIFMNILIQMVHI